MAVSLKHDVRLEWGILIAVLSLVLLPAIPWALGVDQDSSVTQSDPEPVRQPLPFSHRQHRRLGVTCSACHAMAGKGGSAGFPPLAVCLSCHRNAKEKRSGVAFVLEGYERKGQPIPWIRLYKIPDFVFFNHKNHLAAGGTCSTCHGPVERRDVLKKEVPTSMGSCIECHKSRGASVECHFCHELNQ